MSTRYKFHDPSGMFSQSPHTSDSVRVKYTSTKNGTGKFEVMVGRGVVNLYNGSGLVIPTNNQKFEEDVSNKAQ